MKLVLTIWLVLFGLASSLAQAPLGFNYQGIARQADGTPISNQTIGIRVSITEGANGNSQFSEEHFPETNEFGLFTLVVGNGNGSSTLNAVDWSGGNLWLQIELDPDNSGNYILMGSQQLMSVPYALYAQQSGGGLTSGYGLEIIDGTIVNTYPDVPVSVSAGDNITVSGTYPNFKIESTATVGVDDDADPTNELQTIAKTGNEVTLSDGGGSFTDEIDDADADATNEIQDLQLVGNILTITNNGSPTTIDLSLYLDNTDTQLTEAEVDTYVSNNGYLTTELDDDPTNEFQSISKTGATVTLSDGGGSFTDEVDDADADATNEIQTISKTGSTVTLSNSGGSFTDEVNDADFDPANEIQNLSSTNSGTNRTINISGGSGTTISVADNDNSSSNELITAGSYQPNNTLRITEAGVNTDVSLGTLNADLNAANNTITNLADPVNGQDAVNLQYLEQKDATDFAFNTTISGTGTGSPLTFDLSSTSFDEGSLISTTQIQITETGVYVFNLKGTATNNAPIVINVNNITDYPFSLISSFANSETLLIKLIAGDIVELRANSTANLEFFSFSFFGYKI